MKYLILFIVLLLLSFALDAINSSLLEFWAVTIFIIVLFAILKIVEK